VLYSSVLVFILTPEWLTSNSETTHSLMELCPSWETTNCAATQEIPSILLNPKVHYRVNKSLPLVPILSQVNPLHTIPLYLSKIHFNIVHPPTLYVLVFPSGLTTNILYAFLFSPHSCYTPCPSHPPRLDHSTYAWKRAQVMKNLYCVTRRNVPNDRVLKCSYEFRRRSKAQFRA
jgi:hypothetical protein